MVQDYGVHFAKNEEQKTINFLSKKDENFYREARNELVYCKQMLQFFIKYVETEKYTLIYFLYLSVNFT